MQGRAHHRFSIMQDHEIREAIEALHESFRSAERHFEPHGNDTEADLLAEYYVELAFNQLLIILEHLRFSENYKRVLEMLQKAQGGDLLKSSMGIDDPYLVWPHKLRMISDSVSKLYGEKTASKSDLIKLKGAIKATTYQLCDLAIYGRVPSCEADVHNRIEGILKCVFPDLRTKPTLAKPIKNFIPDSGIPSLKTLIEYKYITCESEAKRIADEILADASAYISQEWKTFLFVIYETKRVKSEADWSALLRACNLTEICDVIVISGSDEPMGSGR
jgi:hypothetical protein